MNVTDKSYLEIQARRLLYLHSMKGPFVDQLFNHFYDQFIDYNELFYDWIKDFITKDSIMLEIGAGRGKRHPYNFADIANKVIGVDMDPRVIDNPNLNEALCIDFFDNDFDDASFDIIFANSVVEHIKDPIRLLTEIKRLLKPDGFFFFKTPNLLHYAMIIAKFTPSWFHKLYCSLSGRESEDTFPTYYQMNSEKKIDKLSKLLKFNYKLRTFECQPDYLFLDPITFLMGVGYERMVNKYENLNKFRILLMVKLEFIR